MSKEIITLNDTTQDIVLKMSNGNPGAMNVVIQMLREGGTIDPDDALQGFGSILSLDTMGIRGGKIWGLYKDVCKQCLPKMLAVLRAKQLGYVKEAAILHAIENYGDGLDVEDLASKVKERLPRFAV